MGVDMGAGSVFSMVTESECLWVWLRGWRGLVGVVVEAERVFVVLQSVWECLWVGAAVGVNVGVGATVIEEVIRICVLIFTLSTLLFTVCLLVPVVFLWTTKKHSSLVIPVSTMSTMSAM